jgi:2-C-methyl-D-erythritol 4-phosphate cytidylyltransferase
VWSIVVAGGSGRRFGALKQFTVLGGRPVLEWAIDACRPFSDGVVLVVPADAAFDDAPRHGADTVVAGGDTRAESVRRGLALVPPEADVVLVHDAARPLASTEVFAAVIAAVGQEGVDGAVPGVSVRDTIKQVDGAGNVTATLDRNTLVSIQTPQGFRAGILRRAHEQGSPDATDDAVLVEAIGGRVRVVPGDPANLKITTAEDMSDAQHRLLIPEAD